MGAGCGCGVKHGWWIGWKDVEEEEKKRRKKKGGGDHVHSAEYIQSTEYIVQSTEYRNKEISDWIETDRIGSDGKVQAQVLASANGRNRFEPGPDDGRVLAKIQREEILDGFVRSFFFFVFSFFFFPFFTHRSVCIRIENCIKNSIRERERERDRDRDRDGAAAVLIVHAQHDMTQNKKAKQKGRGEEKWGEMVQEAAGAGAGKRGGMGGCGDWE